MLCAIHPDAFSQIIRFNTSLKREKKEHPKKGSRQHAADTSNACRLGKLSAASSSLKPHALHINWCK